MKTEAQFRLMSGALTLAMGTLWPFLSPGQIVTAIDLTGATGGGRVWGTTVDQQVGEANIGNNVRAALWGGSADSYKDLTPGDAIAALLHGVGGGQQVGVIWQLNTQPHAGLWLGTPGSFVDLQPAGAYASEAYATSGSQQVGITWVPSGPTAHASLWSGSATSFVDLQPAGAVFSAALAISGGHQGGYAKFGGESGPVHAALWAGDASSFVDLNPPGSANSQVNGMWGDQQVGDAFRHAAIWHGSAASFVDLNPEGALASELQATIGSWQAGDAWIDGALRAGVWTGTPESFLDLQASLGPGFMDSCATAIAMDGSTLLVGGYAQKTSEFFERPFLWVITPVPEPQGVLLVGSILLPAERRAVRRLRKARAT